MKVLRLVSTSILVFMLISCASAYKMSPNAQRVKAGMNKAKALKIVASVVKPSSRAGGVCPEGTTGFSNAPGRPIDMRGSVIHFYAYKIIKVESKIMERKLITTRKLGRYQIDVTNMNKIAVLKTTRKYGRCLDNKPGYVLKLHDKSSEVKIIHLNVAESDLDTVMAALSYLSPGAELEDAGTFS